MDDVNFRQAVDAVLGLEGGYVHDPDDPGGETKFGISKRSYPNVDIRNLTREDAIQIYRRDFWEPNRYGQIAYPPLAAKVFDMAVNMGSRTANRLLQRACNRIGGRPVEEDGTLGPVSLEAINSHPNPEWLLATLRLQAVEYYLKLRNPKYLAGWIKRALA